jgi:AraC family transcriptional regulator
MEMSTLPTAGVLPGKPATSVRIETIDPMPVAYVRHIGPYAGDEALFGRLFEKLCQWVGARGLFRPDTKMLTIYHDNPDVTEPEKLRISVCASVPPGTAPEGEVGVMAVEGGKYAVASFELDPAEYGPAWQWFMGTWFPSSGFEPDDRMCFELSLNDPHKHPHGKHIVEFWEPVRPL